VIELDIPTSQFEPSGQGRGDERVSKAPPAALGSGQLAALVAREVCIDPAPHAIRELLGCLWRRGDGPSMMPMSDPLATSPAVRWWRLPLAWSPVTTLVDPAEAPLAR